LFVFAFIIVETKHFLVNPNACFFFVNFFFVFFVMNTIIAS
jgi:hypothetical protein